jgi:ATP-dependent DNA ligase
MIGHLRRCPRGTTSHEIKHDFRTLARRDAKGVRLLTRNGRADSTRPPLDFVVGGDLGGADVEKLTGGLARLGAVRGIRP